MKLYESMSRFLPVVVVPVMLGLMPTLALANDEVPLGVSTVYFELN